MQPKIIDREHNPSKRILSCSSENYNFPQEYEWRLKKGVLYILYDNDVFLPPFNFF